MPRVKKGCHWDAFEEARCMDESSGRKTKHQGDPRLKNLDLFAQNFSEARTGDCRPGLSAVGHKFTACFVPEPAFDGIRDVRVLKVEMVDEISQVTAIFVGVGRCGGPL
jgi:hypothetical protein